MKTLIIFVLFISIATRGQTIYFYESDTPIVTVDSTKTEGKLTERALEDYLNIIKEIISIIGLALGIIWGFPILKKKLQEDHIKKLLEETQESNKQIIKECHRLIEKHSTRTYKNLPVNNKELQNIYLEVREIDVKSHNTSKEIASLVYLLKNTFQGVLRHYEKTSSHIITTSELYNFYLDILSDIIFYATKVVTIPKKASTKNVRIIKKELDPFLTENYYKKYKFFEIGLDIKATSPITFQFFSHINNCSFLFQRSAYQIIDNSAPIARLLYFYKIYIPITLCAKEKDNLFGDSKLRLIGFKLMNSFSEKGAKNTVDAYYSNLNDVYLFVEGSLTKSRFVNDYIETYIKSDTIEEAKINYFGKFKPEGIKVSFDQDYLKELFKKNKTLLAKKMKSELKRT